MRIDIDFNKLTLGELKQFERLGGDVTRPSSATTITALVFIALKKDNPNITMEEVEALTISDLEFDQETEPGKLDPKVSKPSEQG